MATTVSRQRRQRHCSIHRRTNMTASSLCCCWFLSLALLWSLAEAAVHTNPTTTAALHRPRLHAALGKWWTSRVTPRRSRHARLSQAVVESPSTSTAVDTAEFEPHDEEQESNSDSEASETHSQKQHKIQVDDGMRLPLTPWQRRLFSRPRKVSTVEQEERTAQQQQESGSNEQLEELQEIDHDSDVLDIVPRDEESFDESKEHSSLQKQEPRQVQVDSQVTSLLALPTLANLKSALHSILQHPHLAKWSITGIQLGLALYLLNGIWRAAAEVIDEIDRESSPHFFKVDQVKQIVKELQQDDSSSLLQQQPTLQHLTQTLLASGMPLLSEHEETSVEQVLLSLTRAEANLLQQCLWTPQATCFADISGLHPIKQSLLDLVWTLKSKNPKTNPYLKKNPYAHLVEHPPGVLLYGPPGCGKTMLVKALASAAQLPCLVVTPSVLLRKYVGDTNLQVRALFSLAQKLSPCIVCIDELDGLFRERSSTEHDVSRDLKTEFLQWWDGIASDGTILIIGATNRPFEVDSAVLRRMPQSYFVGLPNYEARKHFLAYLLKSIPVAPDVELHSLASQTEGYTPSDLRQVVRTAITMGPLREARFSQQYRPLSMNDVGQARAAVTPTPLTPGYRAALIEYAQRNSGGMHASNGSNNNPWDSFFNAGTIHADQGIVWNEEGEEEDDDDDIFYDDEGSDSEGLE